MFHQTKQYLKFLIKSTNQYGVHSPFVYDFVTKCIYDKKNYDDYNTIKGYRKSLLKNSSKIKVLDLGAGSHIMKHEERTVSNIAINSGSTAKNAKLLYRISKYFKPKTILELGTSMGIATMALSLGNKKATITTIEGCPNISEFAKKQLKQLQLGNINMSTGDFKSEIDKLKSHEYDLIFFDGNHKKEATLNYFDTLLQTAHNDSIFIFDDINWSKGMTKAWEIIKKHPKVSVSIDTFFWGIVFFRTEQVKEDFVIRT